MTNNPPVQDKNLPAYHPYNDEEEISLIDLWLVLVRRRAVFAIVVIACLSVGLLYAFTAPRMYQYSTSIEIGTRAIGAEISMFELPQTLLAKIEESYIPLERQNYLATHPERKGVPVIQAHIPKGGQIIVLSSQGPKEEEALHLHLQQAVVDYANRDHDRIASVFRKEIKAQQQRALVELEEIKDNITLLKTGEKRPGELKTLLQKQAAEARADLQRALVERERAVGEVNGATQAMTLLIVDSEIQKHRQLLSGIDERLQIEVKEKQDALTKQLAFYQRAQINQQNLIDSLGLELSNLRVTRALVPPMRSLEPVGQEKMTVVLLSLFLGLMLGVLAGFFAEFLFKARAQSRQASEN